MLDSLPPWPPGFIAEGRNYTFARWFVGTTPMAKGQVTLQVKMDAPRVVVAQYDWRLPGDMNEDCQVNVLDLIQTRNKLGTKCSQ